MSVSNILELSGSKLLLDRCSGIMDDTLLKGSIQYRPLPIRRPHDERISEFLEFTLCAAQSPDRAEFEKSVSDLLNLTVNTLPKSHKNTFMKQLLRVKGLVPHTRGSLDSYIQDVLGILMAEHRWQLHSEQFRADTINLSRFNPNRGFLPREKKAKVKVQRSKNRVTRKRSSSSDTNSSAANSLEDDVIIVSDTEPILAKNNDKSSFKSRLCRQCNFPCPVITRSFCSTFCLHLYKIRSSGSYVRQCLVARDKGVCDNCGLETERLRSAVNSLLRRCEFPRQARQPLADAIAIQFPLPLPKRLSLNRRGLASRGQFWHADHIIAVSQGGGESGLEGYRTLCIGCHKLMTNELRKKSEKKLLTHENESCNFKKDVYKISPFAQNSTGFNKASQLLEQRHYQALTLRDRVLLRRKQAEEAVISSNPKEKSVEPE